jgi:tetratricopeptide (TPR) repeat protein
MERGRRWLVTTGAALILAGAVSCARTPGDSAVPASRPPSMRPVELPDLTAITPAVQEQMRTAYSALQQGIANRRSDDQLAAAYGEVGNLLLAAEYADAAEPCYLNAQALAPRDARWPYYLGHVYRAKGEPAAAARAFERALTIGPPDVATLVWLGDAYLDEGQTTEALARFAQALEIESHSVAALFGQGRALLAARDYGRAAESFERALTADPRASIVHYPLALAYRGLGEMKKAEAQARQRGDRDVGPTDPRLQELSVLLHSPAAYETRGLRALDAGNWAAAAEAFKEAVRLAPDNATLHHRLGTALSLSGDAGGAVEQFQEAIRRAPDYAPAHFSLGVLLAASGRMAEAVERFSAAVRYEPDNPEARLQLAAALVRSQRYQDARAQLIEGARRHPDRPEFSRALEQFGPRR